MKKIQPIQILNFSILFIIFTVIGTLTHEMGHIAIARSLGYETTLHYGSINYDITTYREMHSIYFKYQNEIDNNLDFPKKDELERLQKKVETNTLLITIGGPLETILTAMVGILILFLRRKTRKVNGLKLIDWLAIFLTLFWLREVFNLIISLIAGLYSGNYFGGDEKKISLLLNLPIGTISIIMGTLGLLVSLYVVFKVITKQNRLNFIFGGIIGGVIGFILWMKIVGPIVLP